MPPVEMEDTKENEGHWFRTAESWRRMCSLQSSLQVPTSLDVQNKGNDWLRRQSVLEGSKATFHVPRPRWNIFVWRSTIWRYRQELEMYGWNMGDLTFGRRTEGTRSRAYPCAYSRILEWFCVY
ncbi:uncharacterized protein ARMOST_16782 [Armillaria ostoyae]|uniref:Uncharacterized protein n=1 Tax=Armillaria ostoyae TaxID=47428 RepID=A0A284RX53_ARMOS|nr:uncharacterized protein ARMOST_16782 [Armillaria ostoyae]